MDFIHLVFSNWVGLVIGIVLGALVCIVLGFTAFRNNKIAGTIISLLLIIAFGFAGMFVQDFFFSKRDPNSPFYDPIHDPSIDYIEPDTILDIKSNGGYDRSYIEKQLETAEKTEDKIFDIGMIEYKEIVIFYYDTIINNQKYTINVFMYKNDNKIAFDGCLNVSSKRTGGILWWTSYEFLNQMYMGNNFNPLKRYLSSDGSINCYSNVFDIYSKFYCTTSTGPGSIGTLKKTMQVGCLNVYNNYFQQLGDIGLILGKKEICKQMNNFYYSVFNSVKQSNISVPIVDVTNYCAYYNSTDKMFYKCNLFLKVNYTDYSTKQAIAIGAGKDKTIEKKTNDLVDSIVPNYITVPYVKFILSPEKAYNMEDFDISNAPVKLTMIGNQTYTVVFDNKTKLASGVQCPIAIDKYSVKIESNVLIIGNFATLVINKDSNIVKINYSYEYNTVLTSVRLNPLSNFDFSSVNLSENPVTITFNNGTSSYNFVFDSVESLSEIKQLRMPIGNYDWSITSKELAFNIMRGKIVLNVNNNAFVFNYDYKSNVEYTLSINTRCVDTEQKDYFKISVTSLPFKASKIYILVTDSSSNINQYDYGMSGAEIQRSDLPYGSYYIQAKFVLTDGSEIFTTALREIIVEQCSGTGNGISQGYYNELRLACVVKSKTS